MASSGSHARGDQPRSVPDDLKGPYGEMSKRQKAYNAKQEEAWFKKHPGLVESMVPVWGSGREALADAYEGDIVGAVVNTGLAISDLAPGAYALKAGAKGLGKAGSHTWGARRASGWAGTGWRSQGSMCITASFLRMAGESMCRTSLRTIRRTSRCRETFPITCASTVAIRASRSMGGLSDTGGGRRTGPSARTSGARPGQQRPWTPRPSLGANDRLVRGAASANAGCSRCNRSHRRRHRRIAGDALVGRHHHA